MELAAFASRVKMKKAVLDELEKIVGTERMSTKVADLYVYGFDASIHH